MLRTCTAIAVSTVPVDAPAFQTAEQKCRKDLPQGAPVSTSELNELRAGALAMAKCMRAHGVTNFPDPAVSAGPGGHGDGVRVQVGGAGVNPTAPALQAAQQTCGQLIGGALVIAGDDGSAPTPAGARETMLGVCSPGSTDG